MASADIIARLKLNGEQFSREFNTRMSGVESRIETAGRRVSAGVNRIAGAFGVTLGAAAFVGMARDALDFVGSLTEVSRSVGVTVEQYQILNRAAIESGASQEGMNRGLSILNRTLGQARAGVPAAVQSFRALRIDPEQFTNAGDVLPQVMERIRGLRTESEQAAAAQRLFGRGAAELIPFLVQGAQGYNQAATEARRLGLVTSEMAERADEAQDALSALWLTIRTRLGVGIVELIPEVQQLGAGLGDMFDPLADGAERAFDRVETGLQGLARDVSMLLHEIQNALNNMGNTGEDILHFLDPGLARRLVGARDQRGARQYNFADRFDQGAEDAALSQELDRLERRNAQPGYRTGGGPFLSYTPGRRRGGAAADGEDLDLSGGSERRRSDDQIYRDFLSALAREGVRVTSGFRTQAEQDALRRRLGPDAAAHSLHTQHRAVDVGLSATDEQLQRAAIAAGLTGFNIRRKPTARGGPHAHLSWGGGGRPGEGGDIAAQLEREAEQQQQILATMAAQTEQQVEAVRLGTMRAQGLEREASLEADLAEVRRAAAEQMAHQPESERAVTAGLAEQLALAERQAAEFARLRAAHADRTKLTADQRAEEGRAAAAMNESLTAALAMKVTAADNLAIQESRVRVEHAISDAIADGGTNMEKQREESRLTLEAREEAERSIIELKNDAYQREQDTIRDLADFYRDAFSGNIDSLWDRFKDMGLQAISELAARWTLSLFSGQQPMGMPDALAGILGLSGATGGQQADPLGKLAAAAAGGSGPAAGAGAGGFGAGLGGLGAMVPQVAAVAAAAAIAAQVGDMLGLPKELTRPLGFPNLLKDLISPARRGSATLGFDQYGQFGVGSSRGNSGSRIEASTGAIGSVAEMLNRIADQLGGALDGAISVSLGMRDGSWRGDPTGQGITKTKNGAIDFGEDQEAAIRWAIGEALKDGVISGISDASKKILASGQDLERAIVKAAMIEEIPDLLKARLDPVGAALDALNEKWDKTVAALREGGATAEQMAEAQQLYKLELEETIANTAAASQALKSFLDSLKMGPNSPYSLRDQEAMAQATLQPFLDKIAAGEGIDQEAYQAAAQTYLDIERALYGSTGKFFEAMDQVMAATGSAIARIDSAVPIRTAVDPFVEKTAANTTTMTEQLDVLTQTIDTRLLAIERAIGSGGAGGFIGGGNGFSIAASA